MVEQVQIVVVEGVDVMARIDMRYGLLERVARASSKQGVRWLAFGMFEHRLRFVFDGTEQAISNVLRGLRVGTAGAARCEVYLGRSERTVANRVEDAVVWAHSVHEHSDMGPLANPWTSHRDMLGFRTADFFDAEALRAAVDVAAVHRRLGGRREGNVGERPVPEASPRLLMRVAAAVLGRVPSDRRTFALFTQLARVCGLDTAEVAKALMLSRRRVRQLTNTPEQPVETALWVLRDPRLTVVP